MRFSLDPELKGPLRRWFADDGCRDDLRELDELVDRLKTLGADEVVTYDELSDKTFRGKVKEITGGKVRVMKFAYESH